MKLVTEQGRSVAEAARSLGITEKLLRRWKQALASKGADAFPGHGNLPAAEDETPPPPGGEQAAADGEGHPKKSYGVLRQGVAVIFAFIDQHKDAWPVRVMADVLEVSPSGYYAWKGRPASERQRRRDRLLVEITAVHEEVKDRYGSPRIHAELKAAGPRLLRQHRRGKSCGRPGSGRRRRGSSSTRPTPTTPGRWPRTCWIGSSTATRPNESWVADITYIPTREGWLYLAVVEDLYSRKVVGWSMDSTMTSRLVVDALEMAVQGRLPGEGLVAHSDRGSQYASEHYQRLLAKHGIECSMSGVGQCWDNAPIGVLLRDA